MLSATYQHNIVQLPFRSLEHHVFEVTITVIQHVHVGRWVVVVDRGCTLENGLLYAGDSFRILLQSGHFLHYPCQHRDAALPHLQKLMIFFEQIVDAFVKIFHFRQLCDGQMRQ